MGKNLPDSWIEIPLADTGQWVGGGTPRKSESRFWEGSIPWVSPKDMKKLCVVDTEDHISEAAVQESAVKLIRPGAVLFVTRSGILAHSFPVATTKMPVTVNQDLKAIIPYSVISPDYLAWCLRANARNILNSCSKHGTTVHSIEIPSLKEWSICIPPVKEQCRIVDKIETLFSELDKGIEALKTAREQLKVYRQAVLKQAFEGKLTARWREENKDKLESPEQLLDRIKHEREARYQKQLRDWKSAVVEWEKSDRASKKPSKPSQVKTLPSITQDELEILPNLPEGWIYARLAEISRIGSGMSVSKARKLQEPVEIPYLRVANVQRGALVLDEIKTMQVERSSLNDLMLEKWDVLFNEGGDRDKLGRGWIWEGQIDPCITQNHVFRAMPYLASDFHSKFISNWGNTFGKQYFEKGGKQTTNLASINKGVLSMFPVPVPSMTEQKLLIEMLEDTMTLIESLEHEVEIGVAKSETLRQSILKKAFSGQLLPQDPNDEPAEKLLERIRAEREAERSQNKGKQVGTRSRKKTR